MYKWAYCWGKKYKKNDLPTLFCSSPLRQYNNLFLWALFTKYLFLRHVFWFPSLELEEQCPLAGQASDQGQADMPRRQLVSRQPGLLSHATRQGWHR